MEYAADCGTLVVPENRSDPNSRLIALPVVRLRATGSSPAGPIFRFAGGPGKSNMTFSLVPWFIENHDVVMVGSRGIDGSVVLDCPEVSKVFRASRGDMLGEPVLDEIRTAFIRCAERLQDEGTDIDGYTAAEIIKDVEVARHALGYERINLFSWSWGTTVARVYGYMYPESIYRSAMISVDTPGAIIHEPQVVDELVEYYADLCAQDTECSARTDDLAETMREVSHNMPERWLFLPVFALLPAGYVVRRIRTRKLGRTETEHKQRKVATIARVVAMMTVTAILVLTFLYRGPLGGYLVHSLDRGETPLTKALLGLFFITPIILVIFNILAWKNRYWSIQGRVQYTLVALGALAGVYILRDLWGLMFWG